MSELRIDAVMARATVEAVCAVIFFLRKQPRTLTEISHLAGMTRNNVARIVEALIDEGLVSVDGPHHTGDDFTYRWV